MKQNQLTVSRIIAKAGGAQSVANEFHNLTHWAVHKWTANGIPVNRWEKIMEMSGVTSDEIYRANVLLEDSCKDDVA